MFGEFAYQAYTDNLIYIYIFSPHIHGVLQEGCGTTPKGSYLSSLHLEEWQRQMLTWNHPGSTKGHCCHKDVTPS